MSRLFHEGLRWVRQVQVQAFLTSVWDGEWLASHPMERAYGDHWTVDMAVKRIVQHSLCQPPLHAFAVPLEVLVFECLSSPGHRMTKLDHLDQCYVICQCSKYIERELLQLGASTCSPLIYSPFIRWRTPPPPPHDGDWPPQCVEKAAHRSAQKWDLQPLEWQPLLCSETTSPSVPRT
jgi:hypothetical protein